MLNEVRNRNAESRIHNPHFEIRSRTDAHQKTEGAECIHPVPFLQSIVYYRQPI